MIARKFFTLLKEGILEFCGNPNETDEQSLARFEHVQSAVDDLVLRQELFVDHDKGDIVQILEWVINIEVVPELLTTLFKKLADLILLLLCVGKILVDCTKGRLEQI